LARGLMPGEFRPWIAAGAAWMLGSIARWFIIYPSGFSRFRVANLHTSVQVSHLNPKPVVVEGDFVGRVESGVMWGNDFVLMDDTGAHVACMYRQPFGVIEMVVGMIWGSQIVNSHVVVRGWYRRFNAPYIEVDSFTLTASGKEFKCWWRYCTFGFQLLVLVGLIALMIAVK